jgi:hypothetical protein
MLATNASGSQVTDSYLKYQPKSWTMLSKLIVLIYRAIWHLWGAVSCQFWIYPICFSRGVTLLYNTGFLKVPLDSCPLVTYVRGTKVYFHGFLSRFFPGHTRGAMRKKTFRTAGRDTLGRVLRAGSARNLLCSLATLCLIVVFNRLGGHKRAGKAWENPWR